MKEIEELETDVRNLFNKVKLDVAYANNGSTIWSHYRGELSAYLTVLKLIDIIKQKANDGN